MGKISEIREPSATVPVVFFVIALYLCAASMTFALRHPMAGQGAFFVYFKQVITFQHVPELDR